MADAAGHAVQDLGGSGDLGPRRRLVPRWPMARWRYVWLPSSWPSPTMRARHRRVRLQPLADDEHRGMHAAAPGAGPAAEWPAAGSPEAWKVSATAVAAAPPAATKRAGPAAAADEVGATERREHPSRRPPSPRHRGVVPWGGALVPLLAASARSCTTRGRRTESEEGSSADPVHHGHRRNRRVSPRLVDG